MQPPFQAVTNPLGISQARSLTAILLDIGNVGTIVLPILGVAVCFAMMYSLDIDTWYRLFIWLAIGLCIYFGYSKNHSHLRQPVGRK